MANLGGRNPGSRKTRAARESAALGLSLGLCLLVPRPAAAWSEEDTAFGNYLVRELRYIDTATRWLDLLEKTRRLSEEDRAEVESFRIDLLLAQGKEREAERALERFKERFPSHRRVAAGSLDMINRAMAKVLALFDSAVLQTDPTKSADVKAEAQRLFKETVQTPMDAMISDLDAKLEAIKKSERENPPPAGSPRPPPSPERDLIEQGLYQAELSRLKAYIVYSRRLDPGSAERKALLEKGLELADRYVSQRYEYPVMQYDGQLQRGILAFELGKQSLATDHLGILYDIVPPWPGPYSPPVVSAFRNLRLQAVLFGARAHIASGKSRDAVALIEESFLRGKPNDPFTLTTAEDDRDLRQFAVLVRLEYGGALAGAGRVVDGLEEIEKVIQKYTGVADDLVVEARKKLGEVASLQGVALRGADLYQAGQGLKSQLAWEEALSTFQRALLGTDPTRPEDRVVMARCLNEIGEIHFVLGEQAGGEKGYDRYLSSALAYYEVYRHLQDAEAPLVEKVARNFLAATTKAEATRGGAGPSAALSELKDAATKFNEARGSGIASEELKMQQAQRLEDSGSFAEARELYLQVQKEVGGEKVPFYWRARASAEGCIFQVWLRADEAGKKALEAELEGTIPKLEAIVPEALLDEDVSGAAYASILLGQIHFQFERWDAASKALEIFQGKLESEKSYRSLGLGYLVLAKNRLGDCDGAARDFKPLYEDYRDEQVTGLSAQALSDCNAAAGDDRKAALYLEVYLRNPLAKDDLTDAKKLVQFARRLYRGGRYELGVKLVRIAEKIGAGDADLGRQLLVLEAERLKAEKKWEELVSTLESYVERYDARGDQLEDPDVRRDLAEAYIQRGQPRPAYKDYEQAEQHLSVALYIQKQRMEKDPALSRTFFRWALLWCRINMLLGDAGEASAYGKIILFADNFGHTDMGGLKGEFAKLREDAQAKQSRTPTTKRT